MPALNAQSAILDICREFYESRPNRKVVPSTSRLSFWTVLFRHNPLAHSRSRVSNEDGDVFKMAATAKRVRRTGYEMLR